MEMPNREPQSQDKSLLASSFIMKIMNAWPHDPETREALSAAMQDASEKVRIIAVLGLGADARKNQESARKLEGALSDESDLVRLFAARGLLEIDASAAAGEEAMRSLIRDESETLKLMAAGFLLRKHPGEKELISILLAGLRHEREEARRAAIVAVCNSEYRDDEIDAGVKDLLGDQKHDAVPAIQAALTDAAAVVRHSAAVSLARLGAAAGSAVPLLRKALEDSNGGVRRSAEWALRRILKAESKDGAPASQFH